MNHSINNMYKTNKQDIKAVHFFVILYLVIISGNSSVYSFIIKENIYFLNIIITGFFIFFTKKFITKDVLIIFFIFIFISFIHLIEFGSVVLNASLGVLSNLLFGAICFRNIPNSASIYIRVIIILSIISLLFYIINVISFYQLRSMAGQFNILSSGDIIHIGIHNFNNEAQAHRNSGIFWEPGAFAGYLVVALLLQFISSAKIFSKYNILIITTILTTQSSTGYIALFFCLYIPFIKKINQRNFLKFTLLLCTFTLASVLPLQTLSFLAEKISLQFFDALDAGEGYELSRFGNAFFDWEAIKDRPIFGWSATPATRNLSEYEIANIISGQGNGLTGSIVRFGIIGSLSLFIFALKTYYHYSGKFWIAIFCCTILAITLIGEQYLMFPLFFGFLFINPEKNK